MLEVKDLYARYGESEIIRGMTFTAEADQTMAIMGRNGMGKTTLFKSLIGIIRGPGSIRLDGREIGNLPSHERVAAGLAFVPQGRHIFPNLTVLENIEAGLETSTSKKVPAEIFDLFPVLLEMRKRKGGNLSGGQQQQLAIARALVSDPKVLLLDEPTEGIQPSIIKDIAHTLNDIRRMKKITIVVSEQILSFSLAIADRLAVIEKGRLVEEMDRDNCDETTIRSYLAV